MTVRWKAATSAGGREARTVGAWGPISREGVAATVYWRCVLVIYLFFERRERRGWEVLTSVAVGVGPPKVRACVWMA